MLSAYMGLNMYKYVYIPVYIAGSILDIRNLRLQTSDSDA